MLPCVCSVIDNRWRQNMVRTKKCHTVLMMILPHFDVLCDLLLNRRMATWNLFVLYNKETNYYSFLFQNLSLLKSRPLPIWRSLLSFQNEAFSLVTMRSKELCCWKKMHSENLRLQSALADIQIEFWMEGSLVTVEFVSCVVGDSWYSIEDTFSCDTVGCELTSIVSLSSNRS